MRKRIGWLVLILAAFGLGQASAQSAIPDGSFVRDSSDNTWLVSGGQRAAVPIRKASDEEILALPVSGRWVVAAPQGLVALGDKPDWADDPEPVKLTDDPPKVTIKLSSDEAVQGSTIEVTIIASDDVSLDWIEWEGEIERNGQAVDDPVLTTVHRFECYGGKVCSNTMAVTLTGKGKFEIIARARDMTGQRSDANADLTIR
jgi:hypothetical protein